jgi:hypothetical protein
MSSGETLNFLPAAIEAAITLSFQDGSKPAAGEIEIPTHYGRTSFTLSL